MAAKVAEENSEPNSLESLHGISATSKKAAKKAKKWEKKLTFNREKRKAVKGRQKAKRATLQQLQQNSENVIHVSKKETQKFEREKLQKVLECSGEDQLKICIDLQFESSMNGKELSHLASQLRRLYGSNKAASVPAKIILAGLSECSQTFKVCQEKNDGFENYLWHRSDRPLVELFRPEDIVYLSPDATTPLTAVDTSKVYVIGGLVDDSIKKNTTLKFSTAQSLSAVRLPIAEYCDRATSGSFKQILTVNQVFDILRKFFECQNWPDALSVGLPLKTGFIPKICNPISHDTTEECSNDQEKI